MAAGVGYMLAKELSVQAFGLTVSGITSILSRMAQTEGDVGKAIAVQLAAIVPTAKLNIVLPVVADFETVSPSSHTLHALLSTLKAQHDIILEELHRIQLDLIDHRRKWFYSWRTLDVTDRIDRIRTSSKNLETAFEMLTQLLPSCVVIVASRNNHNNGGALRLKALPAPTPLPTPSTPVVIDPNAGILSLPAPIQPMLPAPIQPMLPETVSMAK